MSPLPFRKLVKAISVPSGDHAGASLPTTSNCDRADANGTPTRSRTAPDAIGRSRRMVSSSIAHRLPEMLGAVIAIMLAGFITGSLLVIAYRRFYQGRPLTGPDAMKFPERGIGIDKFKERQARAEQML